MTSHAAVVARGMGKCCVCGCESIKIDFEAGQIQIKDLVLKEGDVISLDGSTGRVMLGEAKLIDPALSGEFQKLLTWADEVKRLGVRTNADTPADAAKSSRIWCRRNWFVSDRAHVYGSGSYSHCAENDFIRNLGTETRSLE